MLGGRSATPRPRRRPPLVRENTNLSTDSRRRHKADYLLLIITAALLATGLIVLYSISPGLAVIKDVSENYFVTKQLTAIGLGILTFAVTAALPLKIWRRVWPYLVAAAIIASVVTLFMPVDEVSRAHRWIFIGGFSFQVAELIKFALLVSVSYFLALRWKANEVDDFKKTLRPIIILIAVVGLVVAVLQSDLGSTAVIIAMVSAMVFISGVPLKKILIIGGVLVFGLVIAVASSSYRLNRLQTYLNPGSDCQAAGYQSCQALIAVGSGGLIGQGIGQGVQAYGYLPEAANDSIFAIMSEKFGFLGISIVLGLYLVLFNRLKRIIERTPDLFNKLLVVGVLAWISTQAVINIGAMIGLLPLKGITLPFISYGGTSLIFLTAALGLVFNISRYTSYDVSQSPKSPGGRKDNYSNDRRRVGGAYNPNIVSRRRN